MIYREAAGLIVGESSTFDSELMGWLESDSPVARPKRKSQVRQCVCIGIQIAVFPGRPEAVERPQDQILRRASGQYRKC
jgi:hypothetical protein